MIMLSSLLFSTDTGFIELDGTISTKFNEEFVLTIDQYQQKVWVPRKTLEDLEVPLNNGQTFRIEIPENKVKYEY